MEEDPGTQSLDFVLPHQNVPYTPCYRNHSHHPEDWPLSGTIAIDKCERQCRFRACKAWSQTAAALRKHVNAHIVNNKLDLRVLPASNGREPLKISSTDDLAVVGGVNQGHFHQTPSIKPVSHSHFTSPLPSELNSDSGYGSTPSSVQRVTHEDDRLHWSSPGKRTSPDSLPLPMALKRIRVESTKIESPTESGLDGGSKEKLIDSHSGHLQPSEEVEETLSAHKLDMIMAKARTLRESVTIPFTRSPYRQGSPLASSESSPRRSSDYAREHRSENYAARPFVQSSKRLSPEQRMTRTISPKVIGLQYHENDQRDSAPSHPPAESTDSYSLFDGSVVGDLRKKTSLPTEQRAVRSLGYTIPLSNDVIDFMKPWQDQGRGPKSNGAITSIDSRNDQTQLPGTDTHGRRIEEFEYNYSIAQNDSPAKEQPTIYERGQTRLDNQTQLDQDLELLWSPSGIESTPGSSSYRQSIDSHRRQSSHYKQPLYPHRISSTIQSMPNPISTHQQLFSAVPQPASEGGFARSVPLHCPACQKAVKTKSELKKHELRHSKPFKCKFFGCYRTEGFSTTNDLERHTRSKHPTDTQNPRSGHMCRVPGCKSKDKIWPRLDNFLSHLKRIHHMTEDKCKNMSAQCQISSSTAANTEPTKPSTSNPMGGRSEDALDLQSLHVLADSAVLGDLFSQWPQGKEQKV